MIVLLGAVSLVLAAAIVMLFAMMGELASRVPEPRRPWIEPVEDVRLGQAPRWWPEEFADVPGRDRAVLLVLSTVCTSCRAVAAELTNHLDWAEAALAVSTPAAIDGKAFVAEYDLAAFPHYVDEGGDWVSAEFGLTTSPIALVLRNGRPEAAFAFSDMATLRSRLPEQVNSIESRHADVQKEAEKT